MHTISIKTQSRCELIDITAKIQELLSKNSISNNWKNGALVIFCPHTTCGLTINEGADPDVKHDMLTYFGGLVPYKGDYHHCEGNSDAHIKSTIYGSSLLIIVNDSSLCLGTWQSVYFCESDGPRNRSIWVQWLKGE